MIYKQFREKKKANVQLAEKNVRINIQHKKIKKQRDILDIHQ